MSSDGWVKCWRACFKVDEWACWGARGCLAQDPAESSREPQRVVTPGHCLGFPSSLLNLLLDRVKTERVLRSADTLSASVGIWKSKNEVGRRVEVDVTMG